MSTKTHWRSEDIVDLVLSFFLYVGSGVQTLICQPCVAKLLYPLSLLGTFNLYFQTQLTFCIFLNLSYIYIIYIVLLSYILCLVLVDLGCTIKYWKKSFPTFGYIEKIPFQGQDVISIAAVLLCLALLLKLWHLYYSVIFLGRVIRFQVIQLALILANNDPDFSILLPRAIECWDCKYVSLCLDLCSAGDWT